MEEKQFAKPVAVKVWGGQIDDRGLTIRTNTTEELIPWQNVELLLVGKISGNYEERSTYKPQGPNVATKVISGAFTVMTGVSISGITRSSSKNVEPVKSVQSSSFAAYLYVKDVPAPYRFDTVGTNYKEFLGPDAGFSGEINFMSCMKKIISFATDINMDEATSKFNELGKKSIKEYGSLDGFYEYAWKMRGKAEFKADDGESTYKVDI